MAKGSKYLTKGEQTRLLEAISNGSSVASWCKRHSATNDKVYKTLNHDSQFADAYVHARENQADTFVEQILAICAKLEQGLIDPNSARVIIDSYKWTASKLKPKTWGEKARVDVVISNKLSMIDHLLATQSIKNVTPTPLSLEEETEGATP